MKRSKSLAVKSRVVRRIKETQNDYRWWRYVDEQPESGYIEDTYEYTEPAYPELQKKDVSRTARRVSLSRTRIRIRLSRLGYRGAELATLVQQIAGRGPLSASTGTTYAGWSVQAANERFGRRVSRELRRGVAPQCIFLDEMGYYLMPGIGKLMEQFRMMRKFNVVPSDEAPEEASIEADESRGVA